MCFRVSDDHIYTAKSTSVKSIIAVSLDPINVILMPTGVTANSETTIYLCVANDLGKVAESGVLHLGVSNYSFIYAC